MQSQKCFQQKFENFLNSIETTENIALEIRNPHYLNNDFFTFLDRNRIIPVLLHGYFMPPVSEIIQKFNGFFEDALVIRLHGPDRKEIEKLTGKKWNKIVLPKDEELPAITAQIQKI